MTIIMDKILPFRKKTKQLPEQIRYLIDEITSSSPNPFSLALETYENLENTDLSDLDFLHGLLEDLIFSSLYLTFYEKLFIVIGENPHLAKELVEKFSENTTEREHIINQQTMHHFEFIINNGQCEGCISCENHHELQDLILYYQEQNIDFFIELYLGMQTIQYAFETILYDYVPNNPHLLIGIEDHTIWAIRQCFFNMAKTNLESP